MSTDNELYPLHVFRFQVEFEVDPLSNQGGGGPVEICSGAFAECTGLEATMEPKVIKEGGRNYGPVQRAGQVTFATVILKRGMTSTRHLWRWFEAVTRGGGYAHRLAVKVTMMNSAGKPMVSWKLEKAMPIKFKAADLNAKGTEVGIEELHLAHEGLSLI
ncbi:MAG TPA: phage tail protein [Pyrinomonadaceae bacterium]|nr:phage tail protein [Pyrinomonadaceae bacterium]